jgi:hypothetical protein
MCSLPVASNRPTGWVRNWTFRVTHPNLTVDDRFGYLKLATDPKRAERLHPLLLLARRTARRVLHRARLQTDHKRTHPRRRLVDPHPNPVGGARIHDHQWGQVT